MTIAEHRAKCIKAMSIAWLRSRGYKTPETMVPDWMMQQAIEEQTATFDSIHGIALVLRADMFDLVIDGALYNGAELRAMSGAGDLTNPPEKKP